MFTQPCKKLWAIFLYVKYVYDLLLVLKICKRLWSIFFYVKLVYDLLLVLKVSIIYEQSLTLSWFEKNKNKRKGSTHYVMSYVIYSLKILFLYFNDWRKCLSDSPLIITSFILPCVYGLRPTSSSQTSMSLLYLFLR